MQTFQQNKMSKVSLASLFAAVLAVALVGCGAQVTPSASDAAEQAEQAEQTSQAQTEGTSMETTKTATAQITEVDAAYVAQAPAGVTIVDVRTAAEFAAGHIPGAVNIEYSASPCTATTAAQDQAQAYAACGLEADSALVLYCKSGVRAAAAAQLLTQAGYTNVSVYSGSWLDWTSNAQNEIEY
jgi:3-mercaptopyruvate sulfurtransferase SseA